jgi:hypothetical protein
MTWEWSHTTAAYVALRTNIHSQPRAWLEVVCAEWLGQDKENPEDLRSVAYAQALRKARTIDDETLADFIYDRAEELSNCTNGGWEAWCCPFGCGPHLLPFHTPEEEERGKDQEEEPAG